MITSVIITAGGSGKRLPGKVKKQFLEINGLPILYHTISRFLSIAIVNEIIVSLPKDDYEAVSRNIDDYFKSSLIKFVIGGKERQESVFNALKACSKACDCVFIHDGVRPYFSRDVISKSLELVADKLGVIPASKVKYTIKEINDSKVVSTVPREYLYNVHTPQCFLYKNILELHRKADLEGKLYTDDAALFEMAGYQVMIVEENDKNLKVTTQEDLELVEFYLKKESIQENK